MARATTKTDLTNRLTDSQILRLDEAMTGLRDGAKRRPSGRLARASRPTADPAPAARKLRLVTHVVKDARGLATDYSVRLAPGAVARIKLQRVSETHSWIDWVYVPDGWRDHGLGGQLMRKVIADADRAGARLSLEARACGSTEQAKLERWYESLGFVRTGRRGPLGPIYARRPAVSRGVA